MALVGIWTLPAVGVVQPVSAIDMGWFLALWGIFSVFMTLGTLKGSKTLIFVFASLDVLFLLLVIKTWTGSHAVGTIAGLEGIVCGAAALYLGMAELLEEKYGRKFLPF